MGKDSWNLSTLRIVRGARLAVRHWRLLVEALALLPAAGLALRFSGLQSCQAKFDRRLAARQVRRSVPKPVAPAVIAQLVRLAAYYGPYRATCLPQSVVVWVLLRRRGLDAGIKIGVR